MLTHSGSGPVYCPLALQCLSFGFNTPSATAPSSKFRLCLTGTLRVQKRAKGDHSVQLVILCFRKHRIYFTAHISTAAGSCAPTTPEKHSSWLGRISVQELTDCWIELSEAACTGKGKGREILL